MPKKTRRKVSRRAPKRGKVKKGKARKPGKILGRKASRKNKA